MSNPHVWYDPSHSLHFGSDMHPEHPARVDAIVKKLQENTRLVWHVCSPLQVPSVEITNKSKQWKLLDDGDCYKTAYTEKITRRVCVMIHEACMVIANKISRCVFVLARPPGHHADMRTGPRGFCHINNIWTAVEFFHSHKVKKIAILDWDVHHGDGTEALVRQHVHRISGIRFVSIHAYGAGVYPGTGKTSKDENVMNIGLPIGTTPESYLDIFRTQVIPYLEKPDILLVSAGYDAHKDDPMNYLKLKTETYAEMSKSLQGLDCPVMFILEGGYNPSALADSVHATLMSWSSS
jgi:acetoin utilization deacetylase AcuC-like enzyme